jgi:PAS domain S-box-containing protein
MKKIFKYSSFFLLLFLFSIVSKNAHSQTDEEQRALWLFNIAYGVSWENEDKISSYTIGVYSSKTEFEAIEKLAASRTIKGKPVEVYRYSEYQDIKPHHIVYVSKNENAYLAFVYEKFKDKNVLLVSDRSRQPEYSVINFNKLDETKKFSLNDNLGAKQNLIFSLQIQKLGGDRELLQRIYAETNKKLKAEQAILEQKKKEIKDKEKQLAEFEKRIQNQRDSIRSKENLISQKEEFLEVQNMRLDSMSFEALKQKEDLVQNMLILEVQAKNIEKQKLFTEKEKEKALMWREKAKQDSISSLQSKKELGGAQETIASQRNLLVIAVIAILVFILLMIITINSYLNKQKVNKQLSEQYVAINAQKDEIQSQSKQLELANTELEKLSLVASETDNAVTIMDVKGNFEWVNAGFTRMYGYTLQLLKNELDDNIIGASGNEEVQRVINEIIESKQTGSYQNLNKARNGEEIWAQTTITPILDENNEVVKLISIDTDITVEKKSEIEIRKQKDQIEFQNEQITSSINYAKNIQQAILPVVEDIHKFFDSFVIFKPRDVVSGDFYWFAHLPALDQYNEKIFVASVDCTGHGVPGAFMSMIGSRLLSEIVLEQKIISPKDILEILDEKVKYALRQETTDNNDGMDMALCMIEKEDDSYHITYSGAKVDLYYYTHKNEEVTILSSERRSIGGTIQKRGNIEFTNKDFYLYKGDMMWLSTDGIIDQNNSERKRFGTPRFVEALNNISQLSLGEQKQVLEHDLAEHQGDEEQRDDITIWGIKFTDKW